MHALVTLTGEVAEVVAALPDLASARGLADVDHLLSLYKPIPAEMEGKVAPRWRWTVKGFVPPPAPLSARKAVLQRVRGRRDALLAETDRFAAQRDRWTDEQWAALSAYRAALRTLPDRIVAEVETDEAVPWPVWPGALGVPEPVVPDAALLWAPR